MRVQLDACSAPRLPHRSSQSWGTDTRFTNYSGSSINPSVTTNGAYVHVVWTDDHDGNTEIYYRQNPTGNSIGIKNISTEIPNEYMLYQNYPNPFNPNTKFRFSLPNPSKGGAQDVKIIVYDVLGREVQTLVNEQLQPGTYEVEFPASSGDESNFASGIYYYSLETGYFKDSKKMVLIK